MKAFIVPAITLLSTSGALAQSEHGPKRFPDIAALRKWGTESFGGGRLDLLSDRGVELAIVNQALTSGVTSSAITIFIKRRAAWVEALTLGPYWLDSVDFKQSGDKVTLKLADSGQEILSFSIAGLSRQVEDSDKP